MGGREAAGRGTDRKKSKKTGRQRDGPQTDLKQTEGGVRPEIWGSKPGRSPLHTGPVWSSRATQGLSSIGALDLWPGEWKGNEP